MKQTSDQGSTTPPNPEKGSKPAAPKSFGLKLSAGSSPPKITAAANPKPPARPRSERTLIIPGGESSGLKDSSVDPDDAGTDELDPGLLESPTEPVQGDVEAAGGPPGDTEEVFVILPEEGEGGQLPVVETMVVDDSSWQGGPTTTEVLRGVPADLEAGDTSASMPITDVPLLKVNPLAEGNTTNLEAAATEGISDVVLGASPGGGRREDDIKVIDEIADIAADLEQEEPLHEERPSPRTAAIPVAEDGPVSGSRRFRAVALVSSLAALVLLGVFFYPDLEQLGLKLVGGGKTPPPSGGQAEALGSQGTGVSKVDGREELRSKVALAFQVGLRADAGKE